MTPNEINRKIAEWLGWTEDPEMGGVGWVTLETVQLLPDWYNTSAAFDLLDALVEKYYVILENISRNWRCALKPRDHSFGVIEFFNESKSVAICEAVCRLIEKEKER